ncbi:hypothetical protein Q765_01150 [Flavobacterium rivuli WB 3.3-2 = DSM 21788]|uniref:Toxin SymE-like domain-containing protein n=1 Tax=Flavobacterium rivuli WB 3.3-2 = DSM 21788 TaxID=1121895 RepID=A0A0A2M8E9_9FLAO|nr:SymE family type I addiction module toxin [Flavobacterium rivuli]KGO88544.1 hypothetical protein Q765_01150 [Flavobacterium rivuli WB 3.3-2 = DSM 21788]
MKRITNKRLLTIAPQFVKNRWTKIVNPKLTLSGNWLEKAGFKIGEKVTIEVEKDVLTIRKVDNETPV